MVVATVMAGCMTRARIPWRSCSQKPTLGGAAALAASRSSSALTAAGGSSSGSSANALRVCSKPPTRSVQPGQPCRCASNRSA